MYFVGVAYQMTINLFLFICKSKSIIWSVTCYHKGSFLIFYKFAVFKEQYKLSITNLAA